MPNLVVLDGVIVNTWSFNDQLFARLVHYEDSGERGYFNLAFPDMVLIRETTQGGNAQQRRVLINRNDPDKVARSQVLLVTGKLQHRDRQVPLQEFLERAKPATGQPGLSDTERATLTDLADKVGLESRAVTEIVVQEIIYL